MLCQYISDVYYPSTQGDTRTISVPGPGRLYFDQYIEFCNSKWEWHDVRRQWKPKAVQKIFHLTRKNLKDAYLTLCVLQRSCDPLASWAKLVQFVSLNEKKKLKGDALRAETLRSAAYMLSFLYRDLYGKVLPDPDEMGLQVINHIPEMKVRKNSLTYLQFVANRFGVNPRPKLVMIVEGQGEERAIEVLFEEYFGTEIGKYGIEIIPIKGVGNASGGKGSGHQGILRLVDYLHHHQTITFVILDNEGDAKKVKEAIRNAKSIHHDKRYVTRPEYIQIWKNSFEFDNFTCREIAEALNSVANGNAIFHEREINLCKKNKFSGARLSTLYKEKTHYTLPKIELTEALIKNLLLNTDPKKIDSRPIIKLVNRAAALAVRNPFPTMHRIWEKNQRSKYLGKKRRK